VDFELSDEQRALQEMARDFLGERWPSERMRQALDRGPAHVDAELWQEIVEMGWLGAAAREEVGGIGGGILTAAVLAEEAGRGLLPGPFLSSMIAIIALDRGRDASVPDLLAGRQRATIGFDEPGGSWGVDATSLAAEPGSEGWVVSGTKLLVPDCEGADLFVLSARTPAGLGLVRIPAKADGITVTPLRRFDAQSISELRLEGVRLDEGALVGGESGAERCLRDAWEIGATLCAADLLGSADASLALSTRYANERVQFGRPIGSFQAVSHRLADVLVEVEIGRSLLYAACLALDEERSDAPAFVSAAKAWLSDAAVTAAEAAVQVHGGVGFTWEYDVHLHMRRAWSSAATFGDSDHHRDRVSQHLDSVHAAREEGVR